MKKIYYRFLTTFLFRHSIDNELNEFLKERLKSGIKAFYKSDAFFSTIRFNDDTYYTFYESDPPIWKDWLSHGRFNKGTGELLYKYDGARPSAEIMYKLMKALSNHLK